MLINIGTNFIDNFIEKIGAAMNVPDYVKPRAFGLTRLFIGHHCDIASCVVHTGIRSPRYGRAKPPHARRLASSTAVFTPLQYY
jgi:hypothetical protein